MLSKYKVSQAHNKAIFLFHCMDIDMDTVDPEQPNQKKNMWIDPFENVRIQKMQMMSV